MPAMGGVRLTAPHHAASSFTGRWSVLEHLPLELTSLCIALEYVRHHDALNLCGKPSEMAIECWRSLTWTRPPTRSPPRPRPSSPPPPSPPQPSSSTAPPSSNGSHATKPSSPAPSPSSPPSPVGYWARFVNGVTGGCIEGLQAYPRYNNPSNSVSPSIIVHIPLRKSIQPDCDCAPI